jgi:hypothetical protein
LIEVHASQDFLRNGFAFHVVERRGQTVSVAGPLVMTDCDAERSALYPPEPTFRLRNDECQALMDELWRIGVRPSEGSGSAGSLRQAEEHIASLQAIAFKLSGVT